MPAKGRAVYVHKNRSGFEHKVFVMYHGTQPITNVAPILTNGLRPSPSGMLGPGIYASMDFSKTDAYGPVTFKLLVYAGKVIKASGTGETPTNVPYATTWLPSGAGVVASDKEENCIKSPKQVICK